MSERKITDIFTRDELKELTSASPWRGLLDVAGVWATIAATFALTAWHPAWYTVLLGIILLGGRQLALVVLMHEASHRAVSSHRGLNDFAGHWLCGAPVWTSLKQYRREHIQHHAHTGTERDPDLGLTEPFPTTQRSLVRKFARDLTGRTGLRRAFGLLLMDVGVLTYSMSTNVQRAVPSPSVSQMARGLITHTGPFLLTNALLLWALALAGHAWLFLVWAVAWLTTYSMFMRIRSIAEHACMDPDGGAFEHTRTTRAGVLARVTFAPMHVNYHLEHHLLMTAPHYKLPKMHRMLAERGALDGVEIASGYREVMRTVASVRA